MQDIEALPGVEHCFDLRIMPWPLQVDTFDVVRGSHIFEHFKPGMAEAVLSEILRILKPGGEVRLYVPNGPVVAEAFLRVPDKRQYTIELIYGRPEPEYLRHWSLYHPEQLSQMLEEAGFEAMEDFSDKERDVHDITWKWLNGPTSLKMRARKPRRG
jgi:SAM-dependent methyltransferase